MFENGDEFSILPFSQRRHFNNQEKIYERKTKMVKNYTSFFKKKNHGSVNIFLKVNIGTGTTIIQIVHLDI